MRLPPPSDTQEVGIGYILRTIENTNPNTGALRALWVGTVAACFVFLCPAAAYPQTPTSEPPPEPPPPQSLGVKGNARILLGGGKRLSPALREQGIFELGGRVGVSVGTKRYRVGTFGELRTADTSGPECSGGLELMLPVGLPRLWVLGGAGKAFRNNAPNDGVFLVGMGVGLREKLFKGIEAIFGVYVNYRQSFNDNHKEVTAGLEFDLGTIVAVPLLATADWSF